MIIDIKSENEIKILRQGGKILARTLKQVAEAVRVGIVTNDLNKLALELIFNYGARSSFEGYKDSPDSIPYPAALCVSVNEEVVHAVPGDRILKEGDIVGLDLGVVYKKLFTDMAITVGVGKINDKAKKLIDITRKSLDIGIVQARPGNHIGDIGAAISGYVELNGFSAVKQLVGHGVGRAVHEEPQIPNYGKPGSGAVLSSGMVIAIEPMVNAGSYRVKKSKDGFGFKTVDGCLSAHFEHTIVITEKGCEVITAI